VINTLLYTHAFVGHIM